MPSAKAITHETVNQPSLTSMRTAYRMSCMYISGPVHCRRFGGGSLEIQPLAAPHLSSGVYRRLGSPTDRLGGGRIWWAHFEFTRISRWEKLGRGGAEMSQ